MKLHMTGDLSPISMAVSRLGGYVLHRRDIVDTLAAPYWRCSLRLHQAALSCVDGVCFARTKCVDCAVGQYSPVPAFDRGVDTCRWP